MLAPILAALLLTSPDLRPAAPVPKAFVYGECGGANRTPRLRWSGTPAGTHSFALTVHDPDAPRPGGWTHWLVYGIRPGTTSLSAALPPGAVGGRNDFGTTRYDGPCPPPGPAHRYVFRLDALDARLPLSAATSYEQYQRLRRGHVLASGVLQTSYGR
jgi:Raf kinase inhibitor-like YbhB/YbcL family protein